MSPSRKHHHDPTQPKREKYRLTITYAVADKGKIRTGGKAGEERDEGHHKGASGVVVLPKDPRRDTRAHNKYLLLNAPASTMQTVQIIPESKRRWHAILSFAGAVMDAEANQPGESVECLNQRLSCSPSTACADDLQVN